MPAAKKSRAPKKGKARTSRPVFASIAVVVSDRKQALEWYTAKLGLDVTASEDHWITVGRKGRDGMLHLCRTVDYDPKGQLEPGNSEIMLRLSGDFAAACEALKTKGVEFSQEPTKEAWGWYAGVRDPDGNELWLAPEE